MIINIFSFFQITLADDSILEEYESNNFDVDDSSRESLSLSNIPESDSSIAELIDAVEKNVKELENYDEEITKETNEMENDFTLKKKQKESDGKNTFGSSLHHEVIYFCIL